MKNLTLARFRSDIKTLVEPVEVSISDRTSGRIRILGFWTPYPPEPQETIDEDEGEEGDEEE